MSFFNRESFVINDVYNFVLDMLYFFFKNCQVLLILFWVDKRIDKSHWKLAHISVKFKVRSLITASDLTIL